MTGLVHLNYQIDYERLSVSDENAKADAEAYTDFRLKRPLDSWLISHYSDDYIQQVIADMGVPCKPRFYWLEKNFHLPEHVDNGTQCSINFILSDNYAPVTIRGVDYFYKSALLNTSIPHGVKNQEHDRVLFKLSIFDHTFDETARILSERGLTNDVIQ